MGRNLRRRTPRACSRGSRTTQHLLGNYDITLDGERAAARTYMHASHVTAEGTIWVVGGTYIDRFERREGEWKIVERTLKAKWSEERRISA